jgi:hypothetical protein
MHSAATVLTELRADGHSFGPNLVLVVGPFGAMFDYEEDARFPLSCWQSIADMVDTFPLFDCAFYRTESRRRRAWLCIRTAEGEPAEERQHHAECLLKEAYELAGDAPTLRLKCVTTWCELWRQQGRVAYARARLKEALAGATWEGRCAAITQAEAMLARLDALDSAPHSGHDCVRFDEAH